jgi:cyclophilin family peptidyl-prolyl cis-trans isomerase
MQTISKWTLVGIIVFFSGWIVSRAETPASSDSVKAEPAKAESTKSDSGTADTAKPPVAKSGPARAEFDRIHKEFNDLNAEMRYLQLKYKNSKKSERPALDKEWAKLYKAGEKKQAEFFHAAELAYLEAPQSDKDLTKLVWNIFGYLAMNDDHESAVRLAKLLVDNGEKNPQGFALAGVAAASLGDFVTAKKYFSLAGDDYLKKQAESKSKHLQCAFVFSQSLPKMVDKWTREQEFREAEAKANDLPRVLIKTEKGDLVVELFENEAPNTVANFISLVEKGFYDGLTFHRVLPGFMAQGGDPKGDGTGGPGYMIPDECSGPNHREHFRGTLSMAKDSRPNSGGSQFFLCFAPAMHLDGIHTAFGRVIEGFDVLSKIQRRDPDDPNMADPDKIIQMTVQRPMKQKHELKTTQEK